MSVLFAYPGQGAQRPGMLAALPDEPPVRACLEQAADCLGQAPAELESAEALHGTRAVQLCLLIAGVAASNARVLVRQNGQEIYQTTVAPGAFEINDLYPTSYSGDLEVEVIEADGAVKSFSVPFSAVPESMRPGISRFNIETGRTRDGGDASWFGDLTWQRGLSNAITFNSGLRLADGYRAGMLGGVYSSRLGAVGLDVTASQARMPGAGNVHGWMSHLSWSKTFQPTGTTLSLAGYRYSTRGYRDLSDVLGIRSAARAGEGWWSTTSSQHSRFDISLSQSLQRLGSLFATGSTQSYRDGRSRDTQLQLGYGNSFRHGIGVNLTVGRQRSGGYGERGRLQTFSSLSFSLPLGKPTRWASGRLPATASASATTATTARLRSAAICSGGCRIRRSDLTPRAATATGRHRPVPRGRWLFTAAG